MRSMSLALAPLLAAGALLTPHAAAQAALVQAPEALVAGEAVAVAYSGFRAGQHPDRGAGAVNPSRAETLEDLRLLAESGVRLVRLYDAGANSSMVLDVIRAEGLPIRCVLGCWLRAELSNHARCAWLDEPIPEEVLAENRLENATEVGRAIALAHEFPGVVCAVSVGNEALVEWNDHLVPFEHALAYVRTVRAAIEQPVTVADSSGWWASAEGVRMAREVDFIGVHTYPVWVGETIDAGMTATVADIARVRAAVPDAPMAILEAGWASEGSEFGARASESIQARYVREVLAWARETNTTVFVFEAFDEPWKGDPQNPAGAEKHWGLWNVDRTPKPAAAALRAALRGR